MGSAMPRERIAWMSRRCLRLCREASAASIDWSRRRRWWRWSSTATLVGGLSIGEPKEMTYETASLMGESLPGNKPRYLMGAGSPEDLVTCIGLGMDMFDCSLPTRVARNGGVFTPYGRVNVHTAPFREREGPIDDGCDCYACSSFPAAYLHHLFRARELLAYRLASVHNLRFVMRLMEEAPRCDRGGPVCRVPRQLPRSLPRHG